MSKELRSSLADPILVVGDYRAVAVPTFTFATTAASGTVVPFDLNTVPVKNTTGNYTMHVYNPNTSSAMTVKLYNTTSVGASSLTSMVASVACATGAITSASVTGVFQGEYSYATCTNTTAVSATNLTITAKLMSQF